MKIVVEQEDGANSYEFVRTRLRVEELGRTFLLDIDFSALLDRSVVPSGPATDFVVFSSIIYAADKIVSRKTGDDNWSRLIELVIPLQAPALWVQARESLARAVSFLTGDQWTFDFVQAQYRHDVVRPNRRRRRKGYARGPFVTLLSGGLDSFIGALDALVENPVSKLQFVSHYDGKISGPKTDQGRLLSVLETAFPGRTSHLQVRTGVLVPPEEKVLEEYSFESTFRSRSLIFIALGVYVATLIGDDCAMAIPENGPIALNLPLNPSRRGACSTRTVHPYFLELLRKGLSEAGIDTNIHNPYSLKTKGEMVRECKAQSILLAASSKSNSCGKAGRKTHWSNRMAKGCGTCVPCIFRRASLHAAKADTEVYGNDVFASPAEKYPDFFALLGLLKSRPSVRKVGNMLMANGRLPLTELDNYADVVLRMLDEVASWIREKGNARAKQLGGITKC